MTELTAQSELTKELFEAAIALRNSEAAIDLPRVCRVMAHAGHHILRLEACLRAISDSIAIAKHNATMANDQFKVGE